MLCIRAGAVYRRLGNYCLLERTGHIREVRVSSRSFPAHRKTCEYMKNSLLQRVCGLVYQAIIFKVWELAQGFAFYTPRNPLDRPIFHRLFSPA